MAASSASVGAVRSTEMRQMPSVTSTIPSPLSLRGVEAGKVPESSVEVAFEAQPRSATSLPPVDVSPATAQTHPRRAFSLPEEASIGRTSEPHAGQWNTLSGSSRISGCPHSQGWAPRASGRPITSRRVSSVEPTSGNPQKSQRAKLGPKEMSLPDSQNGHKMRRNSDAACDGALIVVSFVGCRSLAGTRLTAPPQRHARTHQDVDRDDPLAHHMRAESGGTTAAGRPLALEPEARWS